MRRKSLLLGTCLCLALSLAACSNKKTTQDETTPSVTGEATPGAEGTTDTTTPESTNSNVTVTLGEYKGLEVTMQSTEVTDEEVQSRLDSFNDAYGTPIPVTDKTVVEDGDIVNIDYVGTIDGVAFTGGTATGSALTIGSGQFIDGFEEGLKGKNVGDKVDVNCTFPEDYSNTEVAGKDAVFAVTINFIDSGEKEPLTDAVVAANDQNGNKTIAEYEEYIRTNLKASKESSAASQKEIDIMNKAIENATFEGLEQTEIDEFTTYMTSNYEQMASQYGIDLETYVMYFFGGMTIDEFNTEIAKAADYNVHQKYLLQQVVKDENLALTDAEYDEAVATYMEDYGYTDAEEFETDMGGKEVIEQSALLDKAKAVILDSAVVIAE